MNCFGGKVSESTKSLIQKEVIDLTDTQGDMQIKEEEKLEEGELIKEEPPKLLTDEELEAIADRVDKREEDEQKKRPDLIVKTKSPQESNKIKFLRQGLKTQFRSPFAYS